MFDSDYAAREKKIDNVHFLMYIYYKGKYNDI